MPALLPTGRSQQPAEGRWEYVGYRNQRQVDPFHYYQSEQARVHKDLQQQMDLVKFLHESLTHEQFVLQALQKASLLRQTYQDTIPTRDPSSGQNKLRYCPYKKKGEEDAINTLRSVSAKKFSQISSDIKAQLEGASGLKDPLKTVLENSVISQVEKSISPDPCQPSTSACERPAPCVSPPYSTPAPTVRRPSQASTSTCAFSRKQKEDICLIPKSSTPNDAEESGASKCESTNVVRLDPPQNTPIEQAGSSDIKEESKPVTIEDLVDEEVNKMKSLL